MSGDGAAETLPIELLKRGDALAVLRDGPRSRRELMERLDVSRTTVHRIVRSLEAMELLTGPGGDLELSPFGSAVADEVATYRDRVGAAGRLRSFLETVPDATVGVDVGRFADARVTETKPTSPYGPVGRFMELLSASETLRGFDTTTIAPVYVGEIRDQILGGMETDVTYLPAVVEEIRDAYPEDVATAAESGMLTLRTHEDLPFGLAVFDDRVGLGGYDEETGMLRVFVDTDDPDVREWALDLYRRYRDEATPVDLSAATG